MKRFKVILKIPVLLMVCFLVSCTQSTLNIDDYDNGNGYTIRDVYDAVLDFNTVIPKGVEPLEYESLKEDRQNYVLTFTQFEKDELLITFDEDEQIKELKFTYYDNDKNMSHAFIQVFPTKLFVGINDEQFQLLSSALSNLDKDITYQFEKEYTNVKLTFDKSEKLFTILFE